MFWLCILDNIRDAAIDSASGTIREQNQLLYWIPKCLLLVLIWATLIGMYLVVRLQEGADPQYGALLVDADGYKGAAIFMAILLSIYLIWVLSLVVQTAGYAFTLPDSKGLVYFLTCFTILCTIIGIFAGSVYMLPSKGYKFLGFYVLLNGYIWTLAYSFSPTKQDSYGYVASNTNGSGLRSNLL